MKKTFLSFLLACMATLSFSQLNMTLLDQVNYGDNANDIWGWVDPVDSTEYALVGLRNGFSIVDLSDPTDVQEVQFIPGPMSTWRDIKTWGNHAYVTNETSNGVLVRQIISPGLNGRPICPGWVRYPRATTSISMNLVIATSLVAILIAVAC